MFFLLYETGEWSTVGGFEPPLPMGIQLATERNNHYATLSLDPNESNFNIGADF